MGEFGKCGNRCVQIGITTITLKIGKHEDSLFVFSDTSAVQAPSISFFRYWKRPLLLRRLHQRIDNAQNRSEKLPANQQIVAKTGQSFGRRI
jgi:hypothetical protein